MVKTDQTYKNTTRHIYQIFQENKIEKLFYIKDKWEKELEITVPAEEWNQSF